MQLVKCVLFDGQLLQVRYCYFELFSRSEVADFHVHDVLAVLVDFCINCLFSLLNGLFVLFLGFFFLFYDSLDSFVSKLGNKFVDTGFGVNGEGEVNLKVLLGWIEILLLESGTDKSIGDFDIVVDVLERNGGVGIGLDILEKSGVSDITTASFEFGVDMVIGKV